jgi:integrase
MKGHVMAQANLGVTVWAQKFPDRDHLVLCWHDKTTGRRKTKTAGTSDKKAADKKARELEYEINKGIHREPSKTKWEDFIETYTAEKLSGNRPGTRAKAAVVFRSFADHACPKNLGAIDARMLSQYATTLRTAGRSPATIHGHLAYLQAALNWAVEQKFIDEMPTVKLPKLPKKSIVRTITTEEFERLVAAAPDERWRAFLWTAWLTGMRRTEMLDLHWQDDGRPWVDFGQSRIWIPAAYNKADADQWMPMHPDLVKVLAPHRQARGRLFPLAAHPSGVTTMFAKLAKKAGVRVTLHDLRRSFGSRYASKVPAPVLQRLMRHANIQTTLAFYTNVENVLDEAILKG